MTLRLALFDCDGTLADSAHDITSAMRDAFAANGLDAPEDADIRATIGLSVPAAIRTLARGADDGLHHRLTEAYREAYFTHRSAQGAAPEPLYDGMVAALDELAAAGWQLGIATGKSMRGLIRLLDAHGLTQRFATLQTADHHPSKPDPAMALAALDQTLTNARASVVIGDTTYDMAMARAAGMRGVGVAWGYHPASALLAAGADMVVERPVDLATVIQQASEGAAP